MVLGIEATYLTSGIRVTSLTLGLVVTDLTLGVCVTDLTLSHVVTDLTLGHVVTDLTFSHLVTDLTLSRVATDLTLGVGVAVVAAVDAVVAGETSVGHFGVHGVVLAGYPDDGVLQGVAPSEDVVLGTDAHHGAAQRCGGVTCQSEGCIIDRHTYRRWREVNK